MADLINIGSSVNAYLAAIGIPPTPEWLQQFISSVRTGTRLPALHKTAEFRLLSTDITSSLQSTLVSTFPAGVLNPDIRELRIPGPVPVQVLDIEDIGHSRWSQVEALEMEAKGETRKGHEVIRVVPDEPDTSEVNLAVQQASSRSGPYKLLVQDAKGTNIYAFEREEVQGIGMDLSIGAKLILRDVVVARGVIMLTATGTSVLGGKIDTWDKKWRDERMRVLKEKSGWTGELLQ